MNTATTESNPNPEEKANFLSNLFYGWTTEIYKKGYKKAFTFKDLYDPLPFDRATYLGDRLEKQWNAQCYKTAHTMPSLIKIIFFTFRRDFIVNAVKHLFELIVTLGMPFLLGYLLLCFVPGAQNTSYETVLWASLLVCSDFLKAVISNNKVFKLVHLGGRIRVALSSIIYRKALRLSKTAICEATPGKIVNLLATDITRLDFALQYVHLLWSTPLGILMVAVFIYLKGGWPALIGMVAVFIVVPTQVYLAHLSSKYRKQSSQKTDERVQLLEEMVSGIQIIKMYAWEKPFCALVATARRLELKIIGSSAYLRDICVTFNLFAPRIAFYCTVLAMLRMGERLTVQKVFVILPFYNILAEMVGQTCRALINITESKVSVSRIKAFLKLDECAPRIHEELSESFKALQNGFSVYDEADDDEAICRIFSLAEDNWAVSLQNLTAKWSLSTTDNTLEGVSLKLEKGKSYAVIGMVGSGKSSFFSTILKETNVIDGAVNVKGSLSYASQDPWVFGNTVRQNILFGSSFHQDKYDRVVAACCLAEDFKMLPDGDDTLVGEKGTCLSGGQKARINLARAIYRDADVYLLDDPLSAVDARVGKKLFERCIQGYLQDKTRILATHQIQYVKQVDGIVLMVDGRAYSYSNHVELLLDFPEYNRLLATKQQKELTANDAPSAGPAKYRENSCAIEEGDVKTRNFEDSIEKAIDNVKDDNVFWKFYGAGANVFFITAMSFLFILSQIFVCLNDIFVLIFTNAEESRHHYQSIRTDNDTSLRSNEDPLVTLDGRYMRKESIYSTKTYLDIYSALILSIIIFGLIRAAVHATVCLRASRLLHNNALNALIGTSLGFFTANPSGRILNRFSQDVSIIDELLPRSLMEAIQWQLLTLGSISIACAVNPVTFVPALITLALCYLVTVIFRRTQTHIRDLEGKTRAPVLTHLSETLNGISTIRVCKAEKILRKEFEQFEDIHTSTLYSIHGCRYSYGLIIKLLSNILLICVTYSFAIWKKNFSGGPVGLAVSQFFCVSTFLNYGAVNSAEAEYQLMAVERLREYSRLPQENAKIAEKTKIREIPQKWPTGGSIVFKDVCLWYTVEEETVLKNLNFYIKPAEKVGIVGRTGSGKSSLIGALFRLTKLKGSIVIDGIDTDSIPLSTLRSRLSIIPQDPVLFSGTLRYNLDPFNEFFDSDIWSALEQVELKELIEVSKIGLDYQVRDKGSNFSIGQRQLVCLARAILRNNRLLISDEATANVDPQTDSLIQRTIRTKFAQCTVLTVAHRLNTIMDCDKVMVMDKGRLIEFDHPYNLLRQDSSYFAALARETGAAMYRQLYEMAEQAHKLNFVEIL